VDNFGLPVGAHSNAWLAVIRLQMAERVLLGAKDAVFLAQSQLLGDTI